MSVMNREGRKVLLPRRGEFWDSIRDAYAEDDPQAWRRLAMLALQEVAGWPVERIALTLGHRPSYIKDCISEVKCDLRARFDPGRDRSHDRRRAPAGRD